MTNPFQVKGGGTHGFKYCRDLGHGCYGGNPEKEERMDSTARLGRVLGVAAIIVGAGIILMMLLTGAGNLATGFLSLTTMVTGACAVVMANRRGAQEAATSRSSDGELR